MAKKPYEYDIGCVPSTLWFGVVGSNILVPIISWFTHIKVKPDKDFLAEEGPIIVIANHASYLDPMIMSRITHGRKINFVVGEFLFRAHFWGHVFKLGGAIPKKQFVVDTVAVKAMMKVLKRKGVLAIFPEATRSVDGTTITFDDGVAKMAKKTSSAIYIAHFHGSYLSYPRWSTSFIRKGKITAEFVRKLPGSEVAKMSADEIQSYILDGISYNENEWAISNGASYKSKKLAAGLQNIAYKCPKCMSDFTMEYAGDKNKKVGDIIRCSSCGNAARYLPNGQIEPAGSDDKVYADLHEWTNWEREEVLKELKSGDFSMTLDADLFKVLDQFTFAKTGSGKVTINTTDVIYEGGDCFATEGVPYKKGKPVKGHSDEELTGISKPVTKVFNIASMRGLVAKYGKHFEIYDKSGELSRFYVDGRAVCKIHLIVELLASLR